MLYEAAGSGGMARYFAALEVCRAVKLVRGAHDIPKGS
jgi:hypothetical protein